MQQIWYYLDKGLSFGPYSDEYIMDQIEKQLLPKSVLVWANGSPEWQPANQIFNLKEVSPPPIPGTYGDPTEPTVSCHNKIFQCHWSETPVRPWRRYFARAIDTFFSSFIIFACLGFVLYSLSPNIHQSFFSLFEGKGERFWNMLFSYFGAIFLNAAFIGYTGSSPGKYLLGIKITDKHDKPLGYKIALKRELLVWYKGLGLGIPFISFFTQLAAYNTLKSRGKTSWDESMGLKITYRNNRMRNIFLTIFGSALYIACAALLTSFLT
jgi:hypothetical protein